VPPKAATKRRRLRTCRHLRSAICVLRAGQPPEICDISQASAQLRPVALVGARPGRIRLGAQDHHERSHRHHRHRWAPLAAGMRTGLLVAPNALTSAAAGWIRMAPSLRTALWTAVERCQSASSRSGSPRLRVRRRSICSKNGLAVERAVYRNQLLLVIAILIHPGVWLGFRKYRFGRS
jgi:hypothetical protein